MFRLFALVALVASASAFTPSVKMSANNDMAKKVRDRAGAEEGRRAAQSARAARAAQPAPGTWRAAGCP